MHEDPLADRDADSEGEGDSGGEQADVPELERQALERELANGLPDDDDVVVKTAAYVPADWQPAAPKTNLGEKDFSDVDNPGAWHEFAYRPKFEGKGAARKYVGHAMPAGAMPVPLGEGAPRHLHFIWAVIWAQFIPYTTCTYNIYTFLGAICALRS